MVPISKHLQNVPMQTSFSHLSPYYRIQKKNVRKQQTLLFWFVLSKKNLDGIIKILVYDNTRNKASVLDTYSRIPLRPTCPRNHPPRHSDTCCVCTWSSDSWTLAGCTFCTWRGSPCPRPFRPRNRCRGHTASPARHDTHVNITQHETTRHKHNATKCNTTSTLVGCWVVLHSYNPAF